MKSELKPGMYWARDDDRWELVEVTLDYKKGHAEVWTLGYDYWESEHNYEDYTPANLTDPDGKPYNQSWQQRQSRYSD